MLGIDQAKILTKIAISLHEVKSERLSPIFMKSSFLWRYLHKLIYLVYTNSWLLVFNLEVMILNSCTHPANIAAIHFHSLWQAPTPQRQKNPYYCFYWSKISSMTCDWSDAHFSLVKKTIWPIRICAAHYKSIFFFQI